MERAPQPQENQFSPVSTKAFSSLHQQLFEVTFVILSEGFRPVCKIFKTFDPACLGMVAVTKILQEYVLNFYSR